MTRRRWEYMDKELPSNSPEMMKFLNVLGDDGWEVCSIIRIPFTGILYGYLKREREAG